MEIFEQQEYGAIGRERGQGRGHLAEECRLVGDRPNSAPLGESAGERQSPVARAVAPE